MENADNPTFAYKVISELIGTWAGAWTFDEKKFVIPLFLHP